MVAANQIVKRIENCLDEQIRKIKSIYNEFSNGLSNTDNQFEAIGDHQKLSEQIKEQSCSIFDLLDQLLFTIENWSSNHNNLREFLTHKKLINQCVTLRRLLCKYCQILTEVSYRGEFGIKNVNLHSKLTKGIEQLNLSSALISEQPFVKNLNMYTIEQESIFRIKIDEIRFTLINYSDFKLDIVNVRLVEENYLSTFRTTDDLLLSDLSPGNVMFNANQNETMNKIVWVAQNYGSNKKKFKIRVVYLMNNQCKTFNSNPIKYRFQIVGRFSNQIESRFHTDKFCLIQDIEGQENDSPIDSRQKLHNPYHQNVSYKHLERLSTSQLNTIDYSNDFYDFDLNQLDLNQLDLNRHDLNMRENCLNDHQRTLSQYEDFTRRTKYMNSTDRSERFDDLVFRTVNESSSFFGSRNKENRNEDDKMKLDHCIKRISKKFNQRNGRSFKINEIECIVLKERIMNSGTFHYPVEQLMSKELDYFCYSLNTYFRYASFCYHDLVDDQLREKIYGFLNRNQIIRLLNNSVNHSYLIVFSSSVLSTLVLNYFDKNKQLIEVLFFEQNLRDGHLATYLKSNKEHLKFPILKN